MTDKDLLQHNENSRREKKENILRNILRVKEELNELQEDVNEDIIDGGSSCETVTLDDEFVAKREDIVSTCLREKFSADSLEDNGVENRKLQNANCQRNNLSSSLTATSLKASGEKQFKRPSMIPKLARNVKIRDGVKTNLSENKESHRSSPSTELKKNLSFKTNGKRNLSQSNSLSTSQNDISSLKIVSLQQKLKATTSIIKQKIEHNTSKDMSRSKTKLKFVESTSSSAILGSESNSSHGLEMLYRRIAQIKETASTLSKCDSFKTQKGHIEKLLKNISEIKNIADKLTEIENEQQGVRSNVKTASKLPKLQDKTQVKFTGKIFKKRNGNSKLKSLKSKSDYTSENEEEAENSKSNIYLEKLSDLSYNTSNEIKEQNHECIENIDKNDSMVGIFIPSCVPPSNIDEEEEFSGLEDELIGIDISVVFPEMKTFLYKPVSNTKDARLSSKLSDISAETIKSLKRCPKDFTIKMDLIQGRVLLQSSKPLGNNVMLGSELTFTQPSVEEKKSDIINIKPSTECSFASQLISVDSYKSLRATNSEIFNALNVPLVYKSKSRNTIAIKSCGAIIDNDLWSVAFLTKQNGMSMPEITGVGNIIEDAIMESMTRIDTFQIRHQKKRKNRGKQTRSLTLHDMHCNSSL